MCDKDGKKLFQANEQGFEILVIWDSEYRWGNKQEIINKCINFLTK
jgi:G:T-mismatch repair DNA endonuclease (very short patch repair protein)